MKALRDAAERLVEVALEAGATDAISEAIEMSTSQVRFSNSQIDAVNSWRERHAVLFVAVGKRVISSDIRDLDGGVRLAKELVSAAGKAPPSKEYGGIASGKFRYARAKVDQRIIRLKDPSRYVHEAIGAASREGAANVGGTLTVRHERIGICSSGGALASDDNASMDLSVRAFSQPEASGHAVCCASRLSQMRAGEAGERAGRLAASAKNPVQGEEGKLDLVLEPLCFGVLVHLVSLMMSAMRVEIGTSMFAGKLGKRVASEEVTFADDPTEDSIARRAFDHEGVPTARNVVIRKGVFKTYLHNTSTARRFKTKTTANAGPLVPTLWTLASQPVSFHPVVEPGDSSVDEMVRETKHGLLLNNSWYTRYQNYSTGDFSTIPRDAIMRIENGEIVGAVKNIRVSDNMLALWKAIDLVSRSPQEVFWWDEASPPSTLPAVRARAMTITRSS